MATRATRFVGPTLVNTVPVTLVTLPLDEVWLVRTVTYRNVNPSVAGPMILYVGAAAAGNRLWESPSVAVLTFYSAQPWIVAEPGEVLLGATGGGNGYMALHGYKLRA